MSAESIKGFIAKAQDDSELQSALQAAGGNKAAVCALAADNGFSITPEDLDAYSGGGELDEAALDNVAGGGHIHVLWTAVCAGG